MSYKNYLKARELLDKNKHLIDFGLYPQTAEEVKKAEKMLNVTFPKSYINFLKNYGWLSVGGGDIEGLNGKTEYNIISYTLEERNNEFDTPFPLSFIPIYNLGNGEKFCLDTSQMNEEGECPLMAWYFGRIEPLKDDVGEDFGDFLLNFVVNPALDSAKKEGKKVVR